MIQNGDDAQVELDRAISLGLMGYPEILFKKVRVRIVGMPGPSFGEEEGQVTSIGPLGFILITELASRKRIRFYPWNAAIIEIFEN